jgi:hypothetical protein
MSDIYKLFSLEELDELLMHLFSFGRGPRRTGCRFFLFSTYPFYIQRKNPLWATPLVSRNTISYLQAQNLCNWLSTKDQRPRREPLL